MVHQLMRILMAAAVAHGVKVSASTTRPVRKVSSPVTGSPSAALAEAEAPNMSTGTYNGRINIARSKPPKSRPDGRGADGRAQLVGSSVPEIVMMEGAGLGGTYISSAFE